MKKTIVLLLIFSCIEVISQTFGQRYGNKDIAAILYLLSGVLIGLLPLFKFQKPFKEKRTFISAKILSVDKPIGNYYFWIAFGLITIAVWILGTRLFEAQPLDYKYADMLPIMQIMGERWLSGQEVYTVIPEIWGGMQPIYLPAMWMPYTLMIGLGTDIRIMHLLFLLLAVFLALDLLPFKQKKSIISVFLLIPILILLAYVFIDYSTFITITEEPIVVGFYMLLAYALIKKRPVLIAVALSLCFLSRYALVFWAATYLIYSFFYQNRQQAILIGIGTVVLSIGLLYVAQGIGQLELFYTLKDAYLKTLNNPDQASNVLNITQKNIGMARFFKVTSLATLHQLLFWGALVIPPALYTWYHFKGRKWVSPSWFALCSLKLSLVWFFNMNAMPYSYLFYTSTFLSFIILGQFMQKGSGFVDAPISKFE